MHLFHFDSWIRTAIIRNLVELDLCIEKEDPHPEDELLELPKSLFMCKLNTGCFDPEVKLYHQYSYFMVFAMSQGSIYSIYYSQSS